MNVCESIRKLIENAYNELNDGECPINQYVTDVQKDVDNSTLTIKWIDPIPAFYMGIEIGNLLWWASEPTTSLRYIKFLSYYTPGSTTVKIELIPTEPNHTPAHIAKTLNDFLYKAPLMGLNKVGQYRRDEHVNVYFKVPLNEFQPGLIVGLLSFDDYTWSTSLIGDVLELTVTKYQSKE